jgi:hypothetical protein
MNRKLKIFYLFIIVLTFLSIYCGDEKEPETQQQPDAGTTALGGGTGENDDPVAYQPDKDMEIQLRNIEERKKRTPNRFPCDTIALMEHILQSYPKGSYLLDWDKSFTYSIPRSAVIYLKDGGQQYVLALIATSREGERVVEIKNLIGYDESFIDYDSTKLGTAFPYLTLFRCIDNSFERVWEAVVPSHGGFNTLTMEKWSKKNMAFAKAYFYYAQGVGRIEYNYFFINGLLQKPHLLMTIEATERRRGMVDVNGDKYCDYYELFFLDDGQRIRTVDSVTFVWKDSLYVCTRDKRKTTPY